MKKSMMTNKGYFQGHINCLNGDKELCMIQNLNVLLGTHGANVAPLWDNLYLHPSKSSFTKIMIQLLTFMKPFCLI